MPLPPIRIPPKDQLDWSEDDRRALDEVVGVGAVPRPIHLPSVIAQHPTFLPPYLQWAKAVALGGTLSPRHNELLALRTAYLCRSDFEWGVHTQYALGRECLTVDEIAAVALSPASPTWSAIEQALLRSVDELHTNAVITDETWAQLAETFDAGALLEVVFVVGHYTMLSMVTNSAGVQPEAGWPRLPRP
jgi:alkylhydroperoxidase family enzyme